MTKGITDGLKQNILEAVKTAYPDVTLKPDDILLEHPGAEEHGDYSTNIALKLGRQVGLKPCEVAKTIANLIPGAEVVAPGFINFKLSEEQLTDQVKQVLQEKEKYGQVATLSGKKMMVEFAHPNTHKELHIGHMRTLITGEALARIFEAAGAEVFRGNYQGDVGPHVAKAIWGTERLLKAKGLTWEEAEKYTLAEKAHLLGQGYILGNKLYEENKAEIDDLNVKFYKKDPAVMPVYERTRRWSLEYYESFYQRFHTQFDQLYFESEVADCGKKIVLENVGKVFQESDGAIIFPGEKYGLHTRVFVTKEGNPTYEGKDMCLAPRQFADFPFDKCVHVVANEQAGYFQVVIKALELIDPKFVGRQYHLSMGMVQMVGKKISSRTGVLITVDGLLDDVKNLLQDLIKKDVPVPDREAILESTTVAAVKYSVLKTDPKMNSTFDLEKSVSLEGDSGPYLQYTYARARSVLRKSSGNREKGEVKAKELAGEELAVLRYLYRFPEIVEAAARTYSPNLVAGYLFELAKRFNNFYNNVPILAGSAWHVARSETTSHELQATSYFRLALTEASSIVLKNGLNLLGIEVLEKM